MTKTRSLPPDGVGMAYPDGEPGDGPTLEEQLENIMASEGYTGTADEPSTASLLQPQPTEMDQAQMQSSMYSMYRMRSSMQNSSTRG